MYIAKVINNMSKEQENVQQLLVRIVELEETVDKLLKEVKDLKNLREQASVAPKTKKGFLND
jgi:hypothetical protein